jgi:hypothetical protein
LLFRSSIAPAIQIPKDPSPGRGVTRRRLLATGGAAGAAAALGFRPWGPPAAAAATTPGDTPRYLLRSSYLNLSTPDFGTSRLGTAAGLKLEAVSDLNAMGADKKLAGSEDAFALAFSSDTPVESGTRSFAHPDLGVFELFLSPIEGHGLYEVVVNRSVGVPKRVPKPPPTRSADEKKPKTPPHAARAAHVKRLSARQQTKSVVVEIGLNPDSHVKSAAIWVTRNGLVVATATERHVNGRKRVAVRIPLHKRLRGGRYELTVGTKDRRGHMEYKRVRIGLQ